MIAFTAALICFLVTALSRDTLSSYYLHLYHRLSKKFDHSAWIPVVSPPNDHRYELPDVEFASEYSFVAAQGAFRNVADRVRDDSCLLRRFYECKCTYKVSADKKLQCNRKYETLEWNLWEDSMRYWIELDCKIYKIYKISESWETTIKPKNLIERYLFTHISRRMHHLFIYSFLNPHQTCWNFNVKYPHN
jgi:hypothetical protein